MKRLFGRDVQISPLKVAEVDIPEMDCSVLIRELSISQVTQVGNDTGNQLAMMIVDEEGNRLFTTPEQIKELNNLSATVATRILTAAGKLNGIAQAAVDETIKNLLTSQSDVSESA